MKSNEELLWSESNGNHKIYRKPNGELIVKKHGNQFNDRQAENFILKHAPELFDQQSIQQHDLSSQLMELRKQVPIKAQKYSQQGVHEHIAPDFNKIIQQNPSKYKDYDVIKPNSLPGILAYAYQQAEIFLGKKPCDYAVIGFGSMARQEATTFSDFEFGIIVSSSKPATVKEYFIKLTELVHQQVIQLGESGTKKKGVRFDTWDKTPLGKLELINNRAGFLKYLQNEDNETLEQDMLLHMMLGKSCFIYGQRQLFEAYYKEAGDLLAREHKSGANRFEEMFFEDRSKYLNDADKQNPKKLKAAQTVLKQCHDSLDKLGAFLETPEDISLDVKADIYRPIQSAIEIFAGAKGWFQESMFQLPHRLTKYGHVGEHIKKLMLKSANFVERLRLNIEEITQGYQDQDLINEALGSPEIYQALKSHYEDSCELLGFIEENI